MLKSIRKMFEPKPAADVLKAQKFEAERLRAEHEAAGEHHMALAAMYDNRVNRIAHELTEAGVAL
jgi:hypothetical protein